MGLPAVSILIVFYNEARSVLFRTITSVLSRSPSALIREVVVVDDGSTMGKLNVGKSERATENFNPKKRSSTGPTLIFRSRIMKLGCDGFNP